MEKYTIGILTIGSGVGQSVIESLRLSNYNFHTIGLGNNPLAFGAYECDQMILIPSFYHNDYIDVLLNVCLNEKIDVIIPGTDDETHLLSRNLEVFSAQNIRVITSTYSFMELIRDKSNLYHAFKGVSDVFLPCYSLDEAKQLLTTNKLNFPLIAKPKDGNASRGINILLKETDLLRVTECDVIQELAIPQSKDPNHQVYINLIDKRINPQIAELSFQILLDQNGDEISHMVSYNKLKNGIPIEIIPIFDDTLWTSINPIIPYLKVLGARGPINIQGRMTDNGLKCFEINARFTGITGLRAEMGFNEVEKLVLDYLNIPNTIPLTINPNRIGIRQTTNKSIYRSRNNWVNNISEKTYNLTNIPKTVLVSGASGMLGQQLIKSLMNTDYQIIALVRDDKTRDDLQLTFKTVRIITLDEIYQSQFNFGLVDTIIHALFAREYKDWNQTKTSLDITQFLLEQVSNFHIPEFINISSQSIYGKYAHAYPDIKLDTLYSQAKYASELMVNFCQRMNPHLKLVNIRLSTLISSQTNNPTKELIYSWISQAINHETISITEERYLYRLDVKDAATGLTKLLDKMNSITSSHYDFGSEIAYSTNYLAEQIQSIGSNKFNLKVNIKEIDDKVRFTNLSINSRLFYELIEWSPKATISESIISIFELISRKSNI